MTEEEKIVVDYLQRWYWYGVKEANSDESAYDEHKEAKELINLMRKIEKATPKNGL